MKNILKKILRRVNDSRLNAPLSGGGFVEINKEEIESALFTSWRDPSVPQRQYDACTKKELADYQKGLPIEPFDVLVDILKNNLDNFDTKNLLEIGCSSGYYSEVLKIKGIGVKYSGCDYSEAFVEFARKLFPGIDFRVEDACSLTYPDSSFDIVVSGCCLLHIMNYEKAVKETARVAKKYVVFHRTPVFHKKETSYFIKTAYGVRMFEIHFNEREFLRLVKKNSLRLADIITFSPCFEKSMGDFYAYKTYLCEKV